MRQECPSMMTEFMWLVDIQSGQMNHLPAFRWVGLNGAYVWMTCWIISVEMPSFVCLAGARCEHQGERGGILRADAPVRFEWSGDMFLACTVLHLPQPADPTSATSQDRSSLTSPLINQGHSHKHTMNQWNHVRAYCTSTNCDWWMKPSLIIHWSRRASVLMDVETFEKK